MDVPENANEGELTCERGYEFSDIEAFIFNEESGLNDEFVDDVTSHVVSCKLCTERWNYFSAGDRQVMRGSYEKSKNIGKLAPAWVVEETRKAVKQAVGGRAADGLHVPGRVSRVRGNWLSLVIPEGGELGKHDE